MARKTSKNLDQKDPKSAPKKKARATTPQGDNQASNGSNEPGPKKIAKRHPNDATPSMAQYLEIKAANPDSLLWYRMGDFYELFFEDAVVASKALAITLTKRGKHLGEDIPMCGVPVVRADEYLERLIKQGFRVAVCEQLEDPAEAKKRGAKAVVHRDVVRLVTPGTLTEDTLLDANTSNFLCALFFDRRSDKKNAPTKTERDGTSKAQFALASVDISTGEFEVGTIDRQDLPGELIRLSPSEVLTADKFEPDQDLKQVFEILSSAVTELPSAHFDSLSGERSLKDKLGVRELAGFGTFSRPELAAISALLKYIDLTQIGRKPLLRPPRRTSSNEIMLIDAASRASLELTRAISGQKKGSLLSAIDQTVTGPGARALNARLSSPLSDSNAIGARLEAVSQFVENDTLRQDIRAQLKEAPDLARSVSRLSFGRGTPRDLVNIRQAIFSASKAAKLLNTHAGLVGLPNAVQEIADIISNSPNSLREALTQAIIDDPPPTRKDGGFVCSGFKPELDEARHLSESGRKVIAEFEQKYIEITDTKSLKIRHNNILGYYIEVTQVNAAPLLDTPLSETFRHRQTMANAVRFTTDELIETEGKIASAGERALNIEQEIFTDLVRQVGAQEAQLCNIAAALAELDVIAGLAQLAVSQNYVRPIVDDTDSLDIRGGRHPVVEQALKTQQNTVFIENDCILGSTATKTATPPPAAPGFDDKDAALIWLVTGPNMAGKSTFLRQNALIAILAHIGSFVPARYARIGVIDRVFSRVGAADDLARGRSTFMVEMVETAAILNQATQKSLVILDEIGRGTATFDGLSIAWACVEYLHEVCRCRTLFATHYHELTALSERLEYIANVTIEVTEWKDQIIFLHKIKPGAADRSYGIQVAKLAGLPKSVIERAGEVLSLLEAKDRSAGDQSSKPLDELPLFAATRPSNPITDPKKASILEKLLSEIHPDELTPREALEALYRLKQQQTESGK